MRIPFLSKISRSRATPTSSFFGSAYSFFFGTTSVNGTIRNAAKKAGIKKPVSCHILRHSLASALVDKNVNLLQIQKLLGHESLAVTSIYTHTNMEALSEAVNMF